MHKLLPASLLLAAATPFGALADTPSDIAALRQEIQAMRAAYEARLQALEARLQAAEAAASAPAVAAASVAPPAPAAPAGPAPVAAPASPTAAAAAGGGNAFNPAISLILSGLYTRTSKDPATYTISGFQLPPDAEVGPGTRGFSLAESELGFAASIDPWWRGVAAIALHPDDSVSVEEAYVQTTALGNGLSVKLGRFFSGIGYLNPQHAHIWDFVDSPLAYQAMLGSQFGDDGVQVQWLAPTAQYVELGVELGRGRSFPGSDSSRNGAGMAALTAHTGGDIGDSHSWRAGLSYLRTRAKDRAFMLPGAADGAFTGSTRVAIADFVWKWAPNGNIRETNFKLQGEYFVGRERGDVTYFYGFNPDPAYPYSPRQSGWYLQGVYQFMPAWRVGARYDRLDAGEIDSFKAQRASAMIDWSSSEFSRLRLQFTRAKTVADVTDNQWFAQYIVSMGAHGAHKY